MAASVIASSSGAYSGVSGPTVTVTWTPLEGDLVLVGVGCTNTAAAGLGADGWDDTGLGIYNQGDSSHAGCVVMHQVTAGEETAAATSWSLTGLFSGTETGDWAALVIRGADPTTPIDAVNHWATEDLLTTHQIAGLPGVDLATDSLVAAFLFADNGNRPYSSPAGWTGHVTGTGTNAGRWAGVRDALTAAGVDVPETPITQPTGDEGMSFTLAITALASAIPEITGLLDADTPTLTAAAPTIAWSGSTSGLPETTGTLTASTPAAAITVPTSAWTGTSTVPQYTGSLTIDPDADAVTIEVPLSAWSGTTQTPGAAGTLTTTTPAATIAVPTLAWAGAATIPESTGSLAGALPIVAITTPTSAWAGATTVPEGDGILAAVLPTALIAPPAIAWTGGTTAPIYSGLLDTDTPHTLVATPLATWAGASTPPAATTGALDASLPVVTIHTPAMAQATAGPPPPERTLHIAADDRTLHVAYEDRTIMIGAA